MSRVRGLTSLTSNKVLNSWLFWNWCHQMSSIASGCISFKLREWIITPQPTEGAGLNLISMLMVLTNVLWWHCHIWVALNSNPELNCTVNYHIIAFSAVICVYGKASAHQIVGRGISVAAQALRSAGRFPISWHASSPTPPHLPDFCSVLFFNSVILCLLLYQFPCWQCFDFD